MSVEPEYSMLKRAIEYELLPCCTHFQVGILPYFPLASGFLTGKYRRGQPAAPGTRLAVQTRRAETILTPENFAVLEHSEAFAAPVPAGGAGLCLAPGTSSGEQCDCWGDNAGADHGQCQSR